MLQLNSAVHFSSIGELGPGDRRLQAVSACKTDIRCRHWEPVACLFCLRNEKWGEVDTLARLVVQCGKTGPLEVEAMLSWLVHEAIESRELPTDSCLFSPSLVVGPLVRLVVYRESLW